jgi:hypothetical protein
MQGHIYRAAADNGLDPATIVNDARRVALGGLYKDFLSAMEREDQKDMDKIARSILRAQGSFKSVVRSFETRARQRTLDPEYYTPEAWSMSQQAFRDAWGIPDREP